MTEPTGPWTYYVALTCRRCDAEIFYGLCATLVTHRGHPVVWPLEQEAVDCPRCEATNYVGELDVFVEGGVDPEEDEGDGT